MPSYRDIPLENLLLDGRNPRFDNPQVNDAAAIAELVREQGRKLIVLASDIIENGINPTESLIVGPIKDESELFVVYEGNRRIAVLKLLSDPRLIETIGVGQSEVSAWGRLFETYPEITLQPNIPCVVMSREEARPWILKKHTGENGGAGIVEWSGAATNRFRGGGGIEQIVLEEVAPFLAESDQKLLSKISITTVQRLIKNAVFRGLVGLDDSGHITDKKRPYAVVRFVRDIARKDIKVSQLYTNEQMIRYGETLVANTKNGTVIEAIEASSDDKDGSSVKADVNRKDPVNGKSNPAPSPESTYGSGDAAETGEANGSAETAGSEADADTNNSRGDRGGAAKRRKTLIPSTWKPRTKFPKLEAIFRELRNIKVDECPNASAVLLRAVIEVTTKSYIDKHNLKMEGRKSLSAEVERVADYLRDQGKISKEDATRIKGICDDKSLLGIDALRFYAHDKILQPTGTDLINYWDNIQDYLQILITDMNAS